MKIVRRIWVLPVVCIMLVNVFVFAADKEDFSIEPNTNDGKKWRIGYHEGGEFINYQKNLIAMLKALMDMGWIEAAEIPPQEGPQTKELWKWLATEAQSEYLQFVEDAHYTANWDKDLRPKVTAELIDRLNQKKDIDLMLGVGTWAGQNLANDKHHTPTVILSVTDALAAGIIKSIEDSGYDHIHARVDPTRWERQVLIFHNIIGFQKLGVVYENTQAGRTYAAMDKVETVSQELGFEIVSCHVREEDIADLAVAEARVKECFKEVAGKADAIYLTQQTAVNKNTISDLVDIFNSARIPTFAQAGSDHVKYGILLSISLAGFKYVGGFYAETLAKILNGAKPRQLEQIFEDPPKIAINLKTAEIIGYDPPVDVLGAADEIYQEIEKPE